MGDYYEFQPNKVLGYTSPRMVLNEELNIRRLMTHFQLSVYLRSKT